MGSKYDLSVSGAQFLTLVLSAIGQVPWMRDVIAMLPQPGPFIAFQKVLLSFPSNRSPLVYFLP